MSVILPERVDPQTLNLHDFEFEVVCEIAALRPEHPAFPKCKGDPARWVGWRANCCPTSPRYRLLCDFCKQTYQNWFAKGAFVYCGDCLQECEFLAYTPLGGKS